MAQNIQLKRSSLPGKVPDTGSLNLGEIAINTYDGKVFLKKSGSIESIQELVTTNTTNTGSITLTQTGSFGELVVTQDVNIQRDLYVTNDIIGNGDIDVLGNITGSNLLIKGTLTAQSYIVSSSVVNMTTQFASGSTIFGNTSDDTHEFTGSVNITGSGYINSNRIITDADTGSFGASSGGYPESGIDYNTESTTVTDFNIESPQFLIDYLYETSVGTEVGLKGFIGNTSGSTLVVPGNDFIGFVIDDVEVARVTADGFEGVSLPSGLITGSSQLTSSYDTRYVLSGSITQTTWDNIASKPDGIISGSSQLTASLDTRYALSGSVGSGGSIDSRSQMLSQSVAATTWSFNHNLGSQYPIISVYGSTGEIIQPQTIKTIDEDNLEITFGTPISGVAVASLGSLTKITGTTIRQDFTSSISWSFNHNLGDKYVMIQTFDTLDQMMLPEHVTLTNETSSLITFTEAVSGYALATIGGGLPSISASYDGYTLQVQSGSAVWTSILSGSVATASYVHYNNIANKPTLVSGSSQLTSSYDERYVISGSIAQTTWDNIASKPSGIISGSSQLTSSMLATTGSNTFVGTQTMSGSIIPAIDNAYDLGSATYQWRDIYVSSGSLYIDGTKVLGSTGNELQITTDVGQSIKILEAGSDSIILQSADGDIQLKTSGGGNLLFDPTSGLIDVRGTLQIQDGNKITSSGGNSIQFGDDIGITGSINTTGNVNGINLSTFSSSIATQMSTIQTNTGSTNTRLDTIEGKYATTGSNTFIGTQIFTGSVYITSDLIVQGSSSLQNITASAVSIGTNIVQLNTATPAVRFAGLQVIDSGSTAMSASLLWDSINNHWIYQRESGAVYGGGMLISGPRNLGTLGDEVGITNNRVVMGIGGDHISSSNIYHNGTDTAFAGNLEVTGSTILATATIATLNAGNGVVSGSSQVVSILSSLNTYTGSNDTTNTAQNSRLTTIESVTGSYETKGRGIVSGSSQIDVMSTTNIAKLATTGSNIFVGNQIISGGFDLNQKQNGTSNFYFRNSDTTDTNSRTYFNVNAGSTTISFLALNGGDTYIAGTTGKDMYFQQNPGGTVNAVMTSTGVFRPGANGTQDLGSSSYRWGTVYTSDLSLNNGIGDWTIVEGEDDLFLYNNKKGKVYKFALTEVDPSVATPKMS
jgi:hypothetical protein